MPTAEQQAWVALVLQNQAPAPPPDPNPPAPPGDPVPPPGTPVDPTPIPPPPPVNPDPPQGAIRTQVTLLNNSDATLIFVQGSDTAPPFQPPARYETKAPYTLRPGNQGLIIVTNADNTGALQPVATSGAVAYSVLDDPQNTELSFTWTRDFTTQAQGGTTGVGKDAPFRIKSDFATLDQVAFTITGAAAPPAPPPTNTKIPRDYDPCCAADPGNMPNAPKNIALCATHKHVLDEGKKQIIANSLTEYYRNHPNEESHKTPAPDCTPKPNAVDGPKNHVLCAKHGHVYDSYTGEIIADTLQAYDAARPLPRPAEPDCRPIDNQLPAAPAEIKLCATHGHVLDTKKNTIEANTRTMYYRAHPEYAPKPAAPAGDTGNAQAVLVNLLTQILTLLAPIQQFLGTLGALPCATEVQSVLQLGQSLLDVAGTAKNTAQSLPGDLSGVGAMLQQFFDQGHQVRDLAHQLDGAIVALEACAKRNAASEAADWLKSLLGNFSGLGDKLAVALKQIGPG
jgi:hypothetical protein